MPVDPEKIKVVACSFLLPDMTNADIKCTVDQKTVIMGTMN